MQQGEYLKVVFLEMLLLQKLTTSAHKNCQICCAMTHIVVIVTRLNLHHTCKNSWRILYSLQNIIIFCSTADIFECSNYYTDHEVNVMLKTLSPCVISCCSSYDYIGYSYSYGNYRLAICVI